MASSHLFRKNLPKDSPLSQIAIKKYTEVINKTNRCNVFPLLTLNHLALLTNINYFFLRRVVSRTESAYKEISISKNNGKVRVIYEPTSDLKVVQRWILENILNRVGVSPNCFSYVNGKSVVDCAKAHLGAKTLVKLDFSNFFHSLSVKEVYFVFRKLGYTAILSYELSRLCTVPRIVKDEGDTSKYPYSDALGNSFLGQGLPTSGMLANIIMNDFDEVIDSYCLEKSLVYSRYSDDLFISSSTNLKKELIDDLIGFIKTEAKKFNIQLNDSKTAVYGAGRHKRILGLILTEQGVRLPSEFIKSIRSHVLKSAKYGIKKYSEYRNFDTPEGFINYIDGKLSWVKMVDRQKFLKLSSIWLHAKNDYYLSTYITDANL